MPKKLAYREGEQDMIILFHDFMAEFEGGKRERIFSRLIDYGVPGGDSSMSRTVSLPAAVAVHLILSGKLTTTGILRPLSGEIYGPVLDELATMDITCMESTETF